MSKAVTCDWPDVRRAARPPRPWLNLALRAVGRELTAAWSWMAALCPLWVLGRQLGFQLPSPPAYLILLCCGAIAASVLLFQFDRHWGEPRPLTTHVFIGIGFVAGLVSLWRFV